MEIANVARGSRLPHLTKRDRMYFVTFCTRNRAELSPRERDVVLASSVYDHGSRCWIDVAVVMPDHVHILIAPYDQWTLASVVQRMKSAAAHAVRKRTLWQRDYFDRMIRRDEDLIAKREYVLNNPVRKGLVEIWQNYPWIWFPR